MVRATRSSAALQSQQGSIEPQHAASKKHSKKRKRLSNAPDPDDTRAAKQRRSEVKQEHQEPGTGDLPLDPQDAEKILEVLEMIDTQGLLDRVFPLPDPDAMSSSRASSSKDTLKTYSLRALLKDPSIHPLHVLRSAIQPLFPISSHPRSRPSIPAAQQLHFCNLALSLLDQSSSHNRLTLSLSQSTVFPDSDTESSIMGVCDKRRRYALVQRLPSGEWWTSSNTAREGEKGLTAAEAKDMRKGQAELVSIIPALPLPTSAMPSLGELQMEGRKESRHRFKSLHMHPRNLSSGTFLDYGPYASFAPAFDSEGAEVGREGLGEMLMGRLQRRKVKETRRKLLARLQAEQAKDAPLSDAPQTSRGQDQAPLDDMLKNLFPDENMDGVKAALETLQVEDGIDSLLAKNARALEWLNLLQTLRLRSGNTNVKQGTEEWKTAQEIMGSLTLLASLRPRSSTDSSAVTRAPIIPPPSVIRPLQAILPSGPAQGWQGTLDESRKAALRDDTTVHVKASVSQPNAQTSTAAAAAGSQPYGASGTFGQNNQYRAQSTFPFHNSQTQTQNQTQSTYYPNAYLQGQPSGTLAQYPYTYPPAWYNYQAQAQAGQKPATAASFYGNYMAQGGTPRAVGNTTKPSQNGWGQGYGQGQVAATLPSHLRRGGASTPGTQTPTQSYSPYSLYVPAAPAQSGR